MHHTFNAVQLASRWSELTNTPAAETRQRVRILRLANMLPDARLERQSPLSDEQITMFIIASLASDQQRNAPERAKQYAGLSAIPMELHSPFDGMTFGETLADMLRRSNDPRDGWRIMQIMVNQSHPHVEMWIRNGTEDAIGLQYGEHPAHSGRRNLTLTTVLQLDGSVLADLARKPQEDERKGNRAA